MSMATNQNPPGFPFDGYLESLISDSNNYPYHKSSHDNHSLQSVISTQQLNLQQANEYYAQDPFYTMPDNQNASRNENAHLLCNFTLYDDSFNSWEQSIINIFRNGGLLSKISNYHERQPQIEMVKAVITAIRQNRNLVIEAGTGTGKTFAYIIPLLKLGRRVVVSTQTLNLQDQLTKRDTPHIKNLLGVDYKIATLKGREHYVCISRLKSLETNQYSNHKGNVSIKNKYPFQSSIIKITDFLSREPSGDLTLLNFRDYEPKFLDQIAAYSHTCRGSKCRYSEECYVKKARDIANTSDLLIVNHNLLLQNYRSNLKIFNSNPDVIIFDEAHHVPDTIRQVFTNETGTAEIKKCSTMLNELENDNNHNALEIDGQTFNNAIKALNNALKLMSKNISAELYFRIFKNTNEKNDQLSVIFDETINRTVITRILEQLKNKLITLSDDFNKIILRFLQGNEENSQLSNLISAIKKFFTDSKQIVHNFIVHDPQYPDPAYLIDSSCNSFTLKAVPMNISALFSRSVMNMLYPINNLSEGSVNINNSFHEQDFASVNIDNNLGGQFAGRIPVYVFASATLTYGNTFDNYCRWLGIENELHLRVSDPFNYPKQGFLYLPKYIPQGKVLGEDHTQELIHYILPLLQVIDGGFLILCTSLETMHRVYSLLKNHPLLNNRQLLCQDLISKVEIVRNMMLYGNVVTVASASFWEGVDIPGDCLACVVIDRFPFKPLDTFQKAVTDYVERMFLMDPFNELTLPQMITSLKQGVGRLIRSENDFGVIAIADNRIIQSNYGAKVLEALPKFTITGSLENIRQQWQIHKELNRTRQTQNKDEQEIDEILSSLVDENDSYDSYIEDPDD